MKQKTTLVLFLVSILLVGTANLQARPKRGEGGPGKEILEKLDLTKEQKEKQKSIREETRSKMKALHEKARELQEKITQAFMNNASEEEVRGLHKQRQALHQEMGDLKFEKKLSILRTLTPEQRKKFLELKGAGKHRRWGHGSPDEDGD